ncbi:hypothetical protein E2C01_080245 [Portunus trituberculatus]|uniref:Uncharacterized protein n=1 Tax=Portunus trituberculatus TaxID=210409 RepID=A0A5B7IVH8_PORTR|nr:hypothetical protein [Portunus trituberculatus]
MGGTQRALLQRLMNGRDLMSSESLLQRLSCALQGRAGQGNTNQQGLCLAPSSWKCNQAAIMKEFLAARTPASLRT